MKEIKHLSLLKHTILSIFALFFACFVNFSPLLSTSTFAIETDTTQESNSTSTNSQETKSQDSTKNTKEDTKESSCSEEVDSVGSWIVCTVIDITSKAVDGIYSLIENALPISPIESDENSTIRLVWEYTRSLTNIIFIIFLLIVIYSQLTGLGLNNYGIKRILPRLVIAVILVNLSFILCQFAVEISNILGVSVRGFLNSVQETISTSASFQSIDVSFAKLIGAITGGGIIGAFTIALTGGVGSLIWAILGALLPGIIAVIVGFITIAMRQALVPLLVMISPLAFVCFLLPNTEKWFTKWKDLFIKMLVFYPAFSALFGISQLAGWAIINSSINSTGEADGFRILLGLAVQIFPLFFSWSLMKMSGTFLSSINQKLSNVANKPASSFSNYAKTRAAQSRTNYFLNAKSIGARTRRSFDYSVGLRNTHAANQKSIYNSDITQKVQKRLAGGKDGDEPEKYKTDKYVIAAKKSKTKALEAANAEAHTDNILNNKFSTYHTTAKAKVLNQESQKAFLDFGRANLIKDINSEDDIQFLTDNFLKANKRDANNNPIDQIAFDRYIKSVGGETGEQRVLAKIITQASKVESKQRAEYAVLQAKYGHNGYNKSEFRSWLAGYRINDDGWAVDEHGERLRYENGEYVETIRGEIKNKAPERMVLYNKRDKYGLYYDMKDQDGKIVARIHRGTGADGLNYDDAAFIKETLSNIDIPIGDPINDVYSVLAGTVAGEIITPQGQNDIGLARYSTTIGRALANYKGNAAWAGAMFNSMVGNRQVHNSAQMAIDILDSIIKTAKPGALNTQNPASIEQLMNILNPENWDKIFREEDIMNGVNINNKPWGGENWIPDENGNIDLNNIKYESVDNPTYEQRMNTIKRKFLFPALEKITPAIIRNTTPNTVDNQKPGAGDAWSNFIDMIKEQWESSPNLPDPNLKRYDLLGKTREFKAKQHDTDGNPIYNMGRAHSKKSQDNNHQRENPFNRAREAYTRASDADSFFNDYLSFLYENGYTDAVNAFSNWRDENPNATIEEIWEYINNELSQFFTE